MKSLYISDLDGTLLNENAEISDLTAELLNSLIEKGMYFSVATARTNATVVQMLKNVNINVPVVLMNGVATYSLSDGTYVNVENISLKGKTALFNAIREHIHSGFIYCIDNNTLSVFYENTDSPNAIEFIREREQKYDKKFTKVNSFNECMDMNVVYYSIDDKKEKLDAAYNALKKCEELRIEFYRDIYNTDHWYLEVCSAAASKKNAVELLKKNYGFDRVISFGDNLNDLPMFEISDESYAVENAKDEVKQNATGIIGKNTDDAVAKFLLTII